MENNSAGAAKGLAPNELYIDRSPFSLSLCSNASLPMDFRVLLVTKVRVASSLWTVKQMVVRSHVGTSRAHTISHRSQSLFASELPSRMLVPAHGCGCTIRPPPFDKMSQKPCMIQLLIPSFLSAGQVDSRFFLLAQCYRRDTWW